MNAAGLAPDPDKWKLTNPQYLSICLKSKPKLDYTNFPPRQIMIDLFVGNLYINI